MPPLSALEGRLIAGNKSFFFLFRLPLLRSTVSNLKRQRLLLSTATLRTATKPCKFLFFPPLDCCPAFLIIFSLSLFLSLPVFSGMTGNYLLTNPLLRTHDTNPYNNLLAETVVCNTPSPPAFHSPGARPPFTHTIIVFLCSVCVCVQKKGT